MALPDSFDSFVGDHVECGPERKEHGERWCGRSHPLIRPLLRLAHVPEEPRISGSLVRIPSSWTGGDDQEPGWTHPGLLRAGEDEVNAPRIDLQRQRPCSAYRIDHHQGAVFSHDCREFLQRVGDAGRCLVVDEKHGLHVGMRFERQSKVSWEYRLTPRDVQASYSDSEAA